MLSPQSLPLCPNRQPILIYVETKIRKYLTDLLLLNPRFSQLENYGLYFIPQTFLCTIIPNNKHLRTILGARTRKNIKQVPSLKNVIVQGIGPEIFLTVQGII